MPPSKVGQVIFRALGAAIVVAASACGPGAGTRTPVGAAGGSRETYPAGPYGTQEGDPIANHEFVTPDGGRTSFFALYSDPRNAVLLVATSAGWCYACIEAQPALDALAKRDGPRGLVLLETLFEDDSYRPADAKLAATWKEQHPVSFLVVADPSFELGRYYDRTLTPMNMIIDLRTMRIVRIITGWDPSAIEAIIEATL